MVYQWIDFVQQALLPPRCLLCGSAGHDGLDICGECRQNLPRNNPACARCALPLPAGTLGDSLCGSCLRAPPTFDRALAGFSYQPPLDSLITGLKFQHRLTNGRLLSALLAETLRPALREPPQLIMPAPLHNRRLRERGFNQAAELARGLASRLQIPWSTAPLRKTRHTPAQSGLQRRSRRNNVKNSFRYENPAALRHVAVVDDVITTGATAREISRILKLAGVEYVEIWAVARTPDTNPL